MIFTVANFPISGPKVNPTRDDYEIEANLFRDAAIRAASDKRYVVNSRLARLSGQFRRVSRMLSWSPRREQTEEAA